jgi:hypothetical protein
MANSVLGSSSMTYQPARQLMLRQTLVDRGGAGPVTRLIGDHFSFDDANAGFSPPWSRPSYKFARPSRATSRRARLIDDEALSDRPGRTLLLERLLEIMLVEAIRHHAGMVRESARACCPTLAIKRSPRRCERCTPTSSARGRWRNSPTSRAPRARCSPSVSTGSSECRRATI